jgi:antitoxin component YwqK of YwqJK toxin-antitoxin module
MYKTTLYIFLLMFPLYSNAQGVLTPALKDTLSIENVVDRNQISYQIDNDLPYTGTIVEFHENGQLKLRKSVIDGKAEGIWIEWYETGIVRYIGEWKGGIGHGTWMYFHDNGELSERSQVKNDVWEGISESWHKNGVKSSQGLLAQNERVGTWRFWNKDGSLKEIINYKKEQ